MSEQPPPLIRQSIGPNPKHRRDRVRQIWVPFGLFGLLILAVMVLLVVLSVTGQGNNVAKWASISLICLILPTAVMALVLIALTGGMAVLTTLGIRRAPPLFYKVHRLLMRIHNGVKTASDRITALVMAPPAQTAGWQRLRKMLFRRKPDNGEYS